MKTNTPTQPKQPKKVQVSVALPWTIIVIVAFTLAGICTGWVLRSDDNGRIEQSASNLVKTVAELKASE